MSAARVRIFGAGVRARIAVDLVDWYYRDRAVVEGYYDDRLAAGAAGPGGLPILGSVADGLRAVPGSGCLTFVALGTRACARAWQTLSALRRQRVGVLSLVSPAAHVSPSARLGANALVMPGVVLGAAVRVGDLLCAHGGAVVEHDSEVGDAVLLGPGVALAGHVSIGSGSFLGVGVKVMPGVRVGRGVMLGAGAVVVRDIPDHVVAYGCPAVPVRPVRAGDEVAAPEELPAAATPAG